MRNNLSKPAIPCVRNCDMRNANCHSHCEKYILYRKQLDDFNIEERKMKQYENFGFRDDTKNFEYQPNSVVKIHRKHYKKGG